MPWQTLCINAESKISLDQNNIVIDTFNKLGYKAKINTHTTSYIN